MSTQSGITASARLLETVRDLDDAALVIRVAPDSTTLEADAVLRNDHWRAAATHLQKTHPQPAYLVLPGPAGLVFASYIPDDAPIRQKMLYASTKSTLLTQLGSNTFRLHVAWSELDEVTPDSVEGDGAAAGIDAAAGVLTEDERVLKQLDALQSAETATRYKQQLASMHAPAAGGAVAFSVSADADAALAALATPQPQRLVTFGIDVASESVGVRLQRAGVTPDALVAALEEALPAAPLYALYEYAPKRLAFIYTCPLGSRVKERMVYASNKRAFVSHVAAAVGAVATSLEVGDPAELDLSALTGAEAAALTPLKFSKPRGPRRR